MAETGQYGPPFEHSYPDTDRNYQSADNLKARWGPYEWAEPRLDIYKKAIDSLAQAGLWTPYLDVLDVGTSFGLLYHIMREEYGYWGPFIGIDPNDKQFQHMIEPVTEPVFPQSLESVERQIEERMPVLVNRGRLEVDLKRRREGKHVSLFRHEDLELYKERAEDLSIADDESIDLVFAMFMLYHVPSESRPKAYDEVKRVLAPEGVYVVSTSGERNKYLHRIMEQKMAEVLGITSPQHMNSTFTTEIAMEELPEHFPHVQMYKHIATLTMDDEKKLGEYLDSIRSLRDQFSPEPTAKELELAFHEVFINSLKERRRYLKMPLFKLDVVHRSLFLVSEHRLNLPEEAEFEELA